MKYTFFFHQLLSMVASATHPHPTLVHPATSELGCILNCCLCSAFCLFVCLFAGFWVSLGFVYWKGWWAGVERSITPLVRFLFKSSFNLVWMCCWFRGIKLEDSQGPKRKLRHNDVNRIPLAAIVRTSLKNKNKCTCKSGFLCGKLSALQGLPLCHDSLFPPLSLNGVWK